MTEPLDAHLASPDGILAALSGRLDPLDLLESDLHRITVLADPAPPVLARPVPPARFRVLVSGDGRCGCCSGTGEHPCAHECGSCDGSGRDPDSPVCTMPHGADCTCVAERTEVQA